MMAKSDAPLPCQPHELLVGSGGAAALGAPDSIADEAQVCSCNNVNKGQICAAIREQGLESVAAVKQCTRAGTGCGGCVPMVTDIFHAELRKAGKTVSNHLCEHFSFSRTELFALIKFKQLKTFRAVLADCGQGN
jgi:nitrite reductase (NADH) large subunit